MANPVVVGHLEDRFRPLTAAETTVAQTLLGDAWAVLLSVVPDLEARRTAGQLPDALVVSVVSAMVLRVLRNPNGVRQWSVDDYSETRDNALSAGALYVSVEEIRLLTGLASSARRGAFSVVPYQEPAAAAGSESELIEYLRYGERW